MAIQNSNKSPKMQDQITKGIVEDSSVSFVPKFQKIKLFISDMIQREGLKPGQPVPSNNELAHRFGVDKNTVIKALSELKLEGVVYRVQGKGTFVAKPKSKLIANEVVGLIMPTTGHLYGSLAAGIIRGLTEHEYFCLTVELMSDIDYKPSRDKVKALIDKAPSVLVIEGNSSFPFELLEHYSGRVIFVDNYECDQEYPSSRILSDYHEGGQLVANYFIKTGFTKILYFGHIVKPNNKAQLTMIEGFRQALLDHNLPTDNFIIDDALTEKSGADSGLDARLEETLVKYKNSLGVFCHMDSRAKRIFSIARRLDLQIPRDLSVIGYYNTPWCEIFEPTLTSVSIREEEMAEQVVETILTGSERKVFMKPKLVLRGSTVNTGVVNIERTD